jgi:hypothetical protein
MLEGSQRRFLNESKEISAKLVKEEGEVRRRRAFQAEDTAQAKLKGMKHMV